MFNFFSKRKKSSKVGFTPHLFSQKKGAGFTLIEILVVVCIFALLMVMIAGIYVAFSNAQMRTKAAQRLLNDSQYAMELMAKEIKNDYILDFNPTPTTCHTMISGGASAYDSCILLLRDNGQVVAFARYQDLSSSGALDYFVLNCNSSYSSCTVSGSEASLNILSTFFNSADVLDLQFKITPANDPYKEENNINEQPRVTILLKTKNVGAVKNSLGQLTRINYRPMETVQHILQTTVSSRIYRR